MGKIADVLISLLKKNGHTSRYGNGVGPTFWNGKDINGLYHDKKDLMKTIKEIKEEKKKKSSE